MDFGLKKLNCLYYIRTYQILIMNRILNYFKNIKFNTLVNKTIANKGKKKMVINTVENYKKCHCHYHLIVRNYTTKHNPTNPPDDYYWIVIAAIGYELFLKIREN